MAEQRTQAWLQTATPEDIVSAHGRGALDDLLGRVAIVESSDSSAAAALGLTLAQFAQIESSESLHAIAAHLAGGERSSDGMAV